MSNNEYIDNSKKEVPYYIHEGELARAERTQKRLMIVCLAEAIALLILGWAGVRKSC